MGKLRVGLVGCGYIAPTHLLAWENIEGAEVVALCDISVKRADNLALDFDISKTYKEYREMFSKERLDIVDLASSLQTHTEIGKAAAQNRLHVLCQKPLAPSMKEAQIIVDACKNAGVKLMVHQNFRFQPFSLHLKKMIEPDILGKVFYCRIFHRLFFRPEVLPVAAGDGKKAPKLNHQPFYINDERLVLLHMVIHHLDTTRFLFGEPISIYTSTRRFNPNNKGEDHVVVIIEYDDKVCYIEESWVTKGEELIGFRIEGDKGSVEITNEEFRYCNVDGHCEFDSLSSLFPGVSMGTLDNYSFKIVQEHFIDCVLNHKVPITSGEDNLKTLNLVFKGYESAQTHQVIKIDWRQKLCY